MVSDVTQWRMNQAVGERVEGVLKLWYSNRVGLDKSLIIAAWQ